MKHRVFFEGNKSLRPFWDWGKGDETCCSKTQAGCAKLCGVELRQLWLFGSYEKKKERKPAKWQRKRFDPTCPRGKFPVIIFLFYWYSTKGMAGALDPSSWTFSQAILKQNGLLISKYKSSRRKDLFIPSKYAFGSSIGRKVNSICCSIWVWIVLGPLTLASEDGSERCKTERLKFPGLDTPAHGKEKCWTSEVKKYYISVAKWSTQPAEGA